ncbi:hypothetical protein PROVRETT_09460 [Providencia rettgeri DSM 1131]|nr:hypothetical protein [Providencia rettgeri]EFE51223.1 hypothetical protein PROVRETT_10124 [Providencia rettgeri DSM 1131]EFE51732.1 hypothetical protein PROVRETT_09460 [Providencia rettgeri DSM 1131]QXA58857.1 hypothetical protein I6L79_04690 [Providencia rettgeri]
MNNIILKNSYFNRVTPLVFAWIMEGNNPRDRSRIVNMNFVCIEYDNTV